MNVLEAYDLHVCYPDGTAALDGVSFELPAGERMGLIGPNGAGKTSLMLAIMGGLPLSRGHLSVGGVELSRRTLADVRGRCGMIFQDADDQLFMPTLLEDVAFGPLNQGLSPPEALERARAALADVAMSEFESRCGAHLSVGQKRCAAIATILSMRVQLLLLDEPSANLDLRSQRRMVEILKARPEAMLLATHDLGLVRQLCNRVLVLDRGCVVACGPADAILDDAALLAAHGLA
jgi:cobalt/nickel transport system ATP-binding protein